MKASLERIASRIQALETRTTSGKLRTVSLINKLTVAYWHNRIQGLYPSWPIFFGNFLAKYPSWPSYSSYAEKFHRKVFTAVEINAHSEHKDLRYRLVT